jgi:phosphatidylglycerophosphate synthase
MTAAGDAPMQGAIVYLPEPTSLAPTEARVGGRSVLVRLLLAGQRAGLTRIGLPASLRHPTLAAELATDARLARLVVWLDRLDPAARAAWQAAALLLLPANVIIDPRSLQLLLASGPIDRPVALDESKGGAGPVLLAPPALGARLWSRLMAGAPLGDELEAELRRGARLVAGIGLFLPVPEAARRHEVEAALFRSLGIPADTVIDRLLNRRLSRRLTRLFVSLTVTPNQVSLLALATGLVAAWALWDATPASAVLGFLLYVLAVVLDHSDGEVARLTLRESPLGGRLDFLVDVTMHAAAALAMGVTASRVDGGRSALVGLVAAAGVVLSAVCARWLSAPRPARNGTIAAILRELGTRDGFYLVLVAFVLARIFAPGLLPVLVALLAIGSQGFWLTGVVALLSSRGRSGTAA